MGQIKGPPWKTLVTLSREEATPDHFNFQGSTPAMIVYSYRFALTEMLHCVGVCLYSCLVISLTLL